MEPFHKHAAISPRGEPGPGSVLYKERMCPNPETHFGTLTNPLRSIVFYDNACRQAGQYQYTET